MQFNAIPRLAKGTTIDRLDVKVSKVWEYSTGHNGGGAWSIQNIGVTDPSGREKLTLKFKNRDEMPQNWIGRPLIIESVQGDKNEWKGIITDEYNNKQQINVTAFAEVSFPDAGSAPQTRQAHNQRPPNQQAQRPQHGGNHPPAAAPAPHTKTVFGATVGMAINQANAILLEQDVPFDYYMSKDFARDLHSIASQIIRVSSMLEAGRLAPKPESEPPPPPPRQEERWPDPGDQGAESFDAGMAEDEIPF